MTEGAKVSLYGYDTANWREVLVDGSGRLIVVTAAGVGVDTHCYGWSGAAWDRLLVESAANANLRARLYDGANGIASVNTMVGTPLTRGLSCYALIAGNTGAGNTLVPYVLNPDTDARATNLAALTTIAHLYGFSGTTWNRLREGAPTDAYTTPTFALEVMSFLMGYDGSDWNMLRVDAQGHAQVDVLTVPTTDVHLYGYDGSNWQTLLVQSSAFKNLRVTLYAGASAISAAHMGYVSLGNTAQLALFTVNQSYLWYNATTMKILKDSYAVADGEAGLYHHAVSLMGWNGASYDRLRSYPTGILKVGRAEVGLLTARLVGVGQVGAAGARKLYWITMNPSAGASVFELADAAAGGGAVVYDHYHAGREAHHVLLDPPMEFSTGIYLEGLANMTSMIFGYL